MKNEIVIIVQGPLGHEKIINKYFNDFNIIYSTWEGEVYNDKSSDQISFVYNKLPETGGNRNIIFQQISTLNGILKAKELGFKYCIKWRSDMIPTNPQLLISKMEFDKVNLLFENRFIHFYFKFIKKHSPYFCDYIQAGKLDDLYKIWNFKNYACKYPEEILTERINKYFSSNKINLIGSSLSLKSDIFWLKRNIYLSSYNNYNEYRGK